MAGLRSLSDLVLDSKIETERLDSGLRHIFYDTGPSASQRRVRREENWVREKFVGRGSFGNVYLEKCDSGKLRAVKEIQKFVKPGEKLDYMRELEAVAKFSHRRYWHYFVRSYGWFESEESIFIAMEYLENGDLDKHLQAPLNGFEASQITSQVLDGLRNMHENGFVHRDLKPGNIMVVSKGPEWFVKITDFGVSKRRQQDVTTLHTMNRGTLGFVAPEVLENRPDSSYTFSVDMWSLGAVVYRILTNATAFQSYPELYEFSKGNRTFPVHALESVSTSKEAQDFILNLMKLKPEDRLSAKSATQHPWIASAQNDSTSDVKQTHIAATYETHQADTYVTIESIVSKDWSVVDAGSPTSRRTSTYTEIAAVASEISVRIDTNILGNSGVAHANVPLASEARELVVYQKPQVSDLPDENQLCPDLSGATPFVIDILEAAQSQARPPQRMTEVTLATKTRRTLKIGDKYVTSILEETVPYPEYRTDNALVDINGTTNEFLSNSVDELTDQELHAFLKDKIYPADAFLNDQIYPGVPDLVTSGHTNKWSFSLKKSWYEVNCNNCTYNFNWPSDPVEALPCGHWMCHGCLLQRIILSLLSPRFMPPLCCNLPQGEIKLRATRLILTQNTEIRYAWDELRGVQDVVRKGNWTCPRGHRPPEGLLQVTKESPEIWKDSVECPACAGDTRGLGRSTRSRKMEYCLYCLAPFGSCDCQKSIHMNIHLFVDDLKRKGFLTGETTTVVLKVLSTRARMIQLTPSDYMSFGQMQGYSRYAPAPDRFRERRQNARLVPANSVERRKGGPDPDVWGKDVRSSDRMHGQSLHRRARASYGFLKQYVESAIEDLRGQEEADAMEKGAATFNGHGEELVKKSSTPDRVQRYSWLSQPDDESRKHTTRTTSLGNHVTRTTRIDGKVVTNMDDDMAFEWMFQNPPIGWVEYSVVV